MPLILQVFVVAACFSLLLYVVKQVKADKLQLRYALLWLTLAVVIMFCSLFPQLLFSITGLFGFATASNFIFLVGFFFLLAISLSLSIIVSKQANSIKNLTQRLALLEYESESILHAEKLQQSNKQINRCIQADSLEKHEQTDA